MLRMGNAFVRGRGARRLTRRRCSSSHAWWQRLRIRPGGPSFGCFFPFSFLLSFPLPRFVSFRQCI
jgi:hypothetical protein